MARFNLSDTDTGQSTALMIRGFYGIWGPPLAENTDDLISFVFACERAGSYRSIAFLAAGGNRPYNEICGKINVHTPSAAGSE